MNKIKDDLFLDQKNRLKSYLETFIDQLEVLDCLDRHMRKGSYFSCFSSCGISKFEISDIDYQEKIFTVEDPHCFTKVLISTVEKLRD